MDPPHSLRDERDICYVLIMFCFFSFLSRLFTGDTAAALSALRSPEFRAAYAERVEAADDLWTKHQVCIICTNLGPPATERVVRKFCCTPPFLAEYWACREIS